MKKLLKASILLFGLSLLSPNCWASGDPVKGKSLYSICVACHGANGEGQKINNAPRISGQHDWYVERQLINYRDGIRGVHIDDITGMQMRSIAITLKKDQDEAAEILFAPKALKLFSSSNKILDQRKIWGVLFKTDMKCFHCKKDKHDYTFHHMIETDGVSCSIILKRKDKDGKRQLSKQKGVEEKYIDKITDEERKELADLKLVAIDPNMGDLLYCVIGDQCGQTKFRYSQNMRRKETKFKKYHNLRQDMKKKVIDGKSVVEWETAMSAYNKKTLNFEAFKTYIKQKNALNLRLAPFYNQYIFGKLKLGSYIRRQITEARMLKRFEKLFGPPDKVVICIGDWAEKKHRKFMEPVKGKGFRNLFRKAHYKLYLVDEFRASCKYSACDEHGDCSTFRVVENPKPYRDGHILRHGLVKCQTCSRLWNRDTNASSNIWKVGRNAIQGIERPAYLQRAH